ncbi:MAG: PHB depolymerase family esterase [Polyangiales bacterium]
MRPSRWILVLTLVLGGVACGDEKNDSPVNEPDDDGDEDGDDEAPAGRMDAGRQDAGRQPPRDAGNTPPNDAGKSDASTPLVRDAGIDAAVPRDAGSTPPTNPPAGNATMKTISVGGVNRTFQQYVPRSLADKTTAVPLVSVHHGFTMTGTVMENLTSWKTVAEREKFVVVFPDGAGSSPWNVGEGVCNVGAFVSAPSTQDDFAFVKAIVTEVQKTHAINAEQVFVGGFSMGGYFANHIGCKGRDIVRAIAAHSGGTYAGSCAGEAIPALIIHGDSDTLIPPACGTEAHGYWVQRNGCQAATTTQTIKEGECRWNQGCPAGKEVGLCTLKGMDHGWAGAKNTGPWITLQYGGGEQYENAAELMWTFFKKYL